MKRSLLTAIALGAAAGAFAADVTPEQATALLKELGGLNGRALACEDKAAAARSKSLMLAHAPKAQLYGDAFQSATQEAFLAQTRDQAPCPQAREFAAMLDALALRLNAALPSSQTR